MADSQKTVIDFLPMHSIGSNASTGICLQFHQIGTFRITPQSSAVVSHTANNDPHSS